MSSHTTEDYLLSDLLSSDEWREKNIVPADNMSQCESEEDNFLSEMTELSSDVSDECDNYSSDMMELMHKWWLKLDESLKHKLLSLMRTRDFLGIIFTYPMRVTDKSILEGWINGVLEFNANYCRKMKSISVRNRIDFWLSKIPLIDMQGLIPEDILCKIKDGTEKAASSPQPQRQSKSKELTTATANTSKGKQVLEWIDFVDIDVIPKPILDLATDLAVQQLMQSLFCLHNIRYVRISTRNATETIDVVRHIEAALKDEDNMLRMDKTFLGVLQIDVSMYEGDAEILVTQQIAKQLDTFWHSEKLMIRKKYLVLLVDVDGHRKLDLWKVGFPHTKVEGLMVLITTEFPTQEDDELTMAMDLEIRTEDHMLPWEVFYKNAGSELLLSSSAIQRIAVQIVEECHGHLLATALVAKSLKNVEDVELWELALDELRYTDPSYDVDMGVSRVMVNAFINIIWEDMRYTEKHCLMGSLSVPEIKDRVADHHLISYWIGIKSAYTRDEAERTLKELVERSVLIRCEDRYIRLPEEIYDIICSLLRLNIIAMGGLGLIEPPEPEIWHDATQIELMNNKLSELPPSPNCPKLKVLSLQNNTDLMEIPPLFFDGMPMLCTLDLSYTSIRDLPSSFFSLGKLKELCLRYCELFIELPPEIGQLKNLKKLDLEGTRIMHLPIEFQELTNLESLALAFDDGHTYSGCFEEGVKCSSSVIIPPRVLSKFTKLKHLSIDVNPDDERWHENVQIIAPEIFGLKRLQTLNLYIPEAELLNLMQHRIPYFRLIVGHHMQRIISRGPLMVEAKLKQCTQSLIFVNGMDVPGGIDMVLPSVDTFFLDRHMHINHLSEFGMQNLMGLRACILGECNEMQTILDVEDSSLCGFLYLEFLTIFYMKNLRSIIEGPTPPSSFCRLKFLALHTCPKLTTIFTLHLLDNLSSLEELIVEDCPRVTSLVSYHSLEPKAYFFLPSLKKLSLLYLPELVSISCGLQIGKSLEKIHFYYCPKLQSLSVTELSSKKLKVIKGEVKWWKALKWSKAEWGPTDPPDSLNRIFSPINEEADVLTQLTADDNEPSCSNDEMVSDTVIHMPYSIIDNSGLQSSQTTTGSFFCASPSGASMSSNKSPFAPERSHSCYSDQHQSSDINYGSPMSSSFSDEEGKELKHKLREQEIPVLGLKSDTYCFFKDDLHQASPMAKWNWDLIVSNIDLREALIVCARAVSSCDIPTAIGWMDYALVRMVSVSGEPIQRLGAYLLEGLRARLESSGSLMYKAFKCYSHIHILYQICPYWKFAYLSANVVIAEAMENESRIHIIDFHIAKGTQWMSLIMSLARRPGGPPFIRVTGVDDSQSSYSQGTGLQVVGERLSDYAKSCGVPFEFHGTTMSGWELLTENLGVQPGEALAVNFPYVLRSVPDESVTTMNHRDRLLRLVKSLSPKVVTLVEQESNTNTVPFLQRFVETLDYYTAIFESIDVALPRDDKQRISAEQHCMARDIVNMIACEGAERVERHELLGKWRSRLSMAGLTQCPLSSSVTGLASDLLKGFSENYNLVHKDGALYLGWKNRALATSSAWR